MARDKRNTAIFTAYDEWDAENIPIPEKSLLRAVLQNAISDMNREGEFSRRARDFFLNKEEDYIFSFQAICSYLDINPERVLVVVGLTEDQKLKPGDKPYHPNNANPIQPDQANKTASSAPE